MNRTTMKKETNATLNIWREKPIPVPFPKPLSQDESESSPFFIDDRIGNKAVERKHVLNLLKQKALHK